MWDKAIRWIGTRISPRAWRVIDAITTTCPTCAFVRGMLAGAVAATIVWLM